MNVLGISLSTLAIAVVASAIYLRFASKYGPYAQPNFRSLHQNVIPRGAGLAVAVASIAGFLYLYFTRVLSPTQLLVYVVGGVAVAIAGAADDRLDIHARYRMPFQVLTASWIVYWSHGLPPVHLADGTLDLGLIGNVLLLVALVWFYNLYNFIDGIDGMASTATVFICGSMATLLFLANEPALGTILVLLGVSSAGFLIFNWPPAKMFLGDTGSSFIGYVLSAVLVESLWRVPGSVWPWLTVGAFYFADTTLTTTVRVLTIPGWYRPHRSHAYQNLARVWNSHRKVLLLVLGFNLLWVLPMLVLSVKFQAWAPVITVLVYIPIVAFCLRYGPLYENK